MEEDEFWGAFSMPCLCERNGVMSVDRILESLIRRIFAEA